MTLKTRALIQRFGSFLSSMIMPNIGAFIAWGLITALFIPTGIIPRYFPSWRLPNEQIAALVEPMIFYLLPFLIAYTGGRLVYKARGGLAGTVAVMGVIVATSNKLFIGEQGAYPQFLGAMIMGPLAAWGIRGLDMLWRKRIRPGFEMLVNNFSLGIYSALMAILAMFLVTPVMDLITFGAGQAVGFLVSEHLLPLTAILIEPAKVLFLNNAVNHGILTPLGTEQAINHGSSILLLLETNPGPGLGILVAYMVFGRGVARATAPGAALIQFVGGIHEVYFPYVLMKPLLLIATISGSMSAIFVESVLGVGLRSPAAPGSILAIWATVANGNILGVSIGVATAAAVSFIIGSVILYFSKSKDDLAAAASKTQALKGKASAVLSTLAKTGSKPVTQIVFACDAGMGSSAMGASILRDRLKANKNVSVVNRAIGDLDDSFDLVVVHEDLLERARVKTPGALHMSVKNFLESPVYDQIADQLLLENSDNKEVIRTSQAVVGDRPPVLTEDLICLSGKSKTKDEAITEVGQLLVSKGLVKPEYIDSMYEREALVSTFMGAGLAIPHGTKTALSCILKPGLVLIRYSDPILWQADKPVKFVIAVAAGAGEHLETLSSVAKVFSDPKRVQELGAAKSASEIIRLFGIGTRL